MTEAPGGQVLLQVRDLVKRYPGVVALDGVDFDVRAGEVHFLLGQNGAGKSTLIKCVSGLHAPTSGEIAFKGAPLGQGNTNTALKQGIATIYQELDLVEDLSVAANVWLGHEPKKGLLLDRARMFSETKKLLERVDHPHIDPRARVGQLPPAAQQVVSICRALSRKVELLIMDEPSAVLDDHEIESLFAVVNRLKGEGVGMIYISHRLDEVGRIADRVTVLKDGRTVLSGVAADTPADDLVRAMVGRDLQKEVAERKDPGQVVLDVKNLTLAPYFRDVNLTVKAGEIVGIAGLVGAGRSELLHAIYGMDRPEAGSVHLEGRPLPPGRPDVSVASGIGLAPEDRKSQGLLMYWSSIKNVSIADMKRFRQGPLIDLGAERAAASKQLDAIGAHPGAATRLVQQLSGGNQQKVVLARWLLRECKVLLLDEPTRGVDIGAKAEIYKVIAELADRGLAIVMVSSEWAELLGFCDRIVVMSDGRIVHEGGGGDVTEEQILNLVVRREPVSAGGAG